MTTDMGGLDTSKLSNATSELKNLVEKSKQTSGSLNIGDAQTVKMTVLKIEQAIRDVSTEIGDALSTVSDDKAIMRKGAYENVSEEIQLASECIRVAKAFKRTLASVAEELSKKIENPSLTDQLPLRPTAVHAKVIPPSLLVEGEQKSELHNTYPEWLVSGPRSPHSPHDSPDLPQQEQESESVSSFSSASSESPSEGVQEVTDKKDNSTPQSPAAPQVSAQQSVPTPGVKPPISQPPPHLPPQSLSGQQPPPKFMQPLPNPQPSAPQKLPPQGPHPFQQPQPTQQKVAPLSEQLAKESPQGRAKELLLKFPKPDDKRLNHFLRRSYSRNSEPVVSNIFAAIAKYAETGNLESKIDVTNAKGQGSFQQPNTVGDTFRAAIDPNTADGVLETIKDIETSYSENMKKDLPYNEKFPIDKDLPVASILKEIVEFLKTLHLPPK